MARVRVFNSALGLLFTLFGLLAHNSLADVSHVVSRGYLPPKQGNSNELVYKIIHEYAQSLGNNRNYLPPQQVHTSRPAVKYIAAKDFRTAPQFDIKYPDVDLALPAPKAAHPFKNVENNQQHRGSQYLPPHQSFPVNQQINQQSTHGSYNSNEQKSSHLNSDSQQITIKIPTYLPPGYDYRDNNQGQRYSQAQQAEFKAPKYLPPGYDFKNPNEVHSVPEINHNNYQQNVESVVEFQLPVDLPAGYDFVKPDGAEEAIAELHTLPDDNAFEVQPHREQNQALPMFQQPTTGYLPPQMGKVRTVQILNSVAVKTLRVLETEYNGVKHIKILGHSNDNPTGDHVVVKVETPGSYAQTVKIFDNHQENNVNSNNYYGNFPINNYLPPQASHESHKRSVRI